MKKKNLQLFIICILLTITAGTLMAPSEPTEATHDSTGAPTEYGKQNGFSGQLTNAQLSHMKFVTGYKNSSTYNPAVDDAAITESQFNHDTTGIMLGDAQAPQITAPPAEATHNLDGTLTEFGKQNTKLQPLTGQTLQTALILHNGQKEINFLPGTSADRQFANQTIAAYHETNGTTGVIFKESAPSDVATPSDITKSQNAPDVQSTPEEPTKPNDTEATHNLDGTLTEFGKQNTKLQPLTGEQLENALILHNGQKEINSLPGTSADRQFANQTIAAYHETNGTTGVIFKESAPSDVTTSDITKSQNAPDVQSTPEEPAKINTDTAENNSKESNPTDTNDSKTTTITNDDGSTTTTNANGTTTTTDVINGETQIETRNANGDIIEYTKIPAQKSIDAMLSSGSYNPNITHTTKYAPGKGSRSKRITEVAFTKGIDGTKYIEKYDPNNLNNEGNPTMTESTEIKSDGTTRVITYDAKGNTLTDVTTPALKKSQEPAQSAPDTQPTPQTTTKPNDQEITSNLSANKPATPASADPQTAKIATAVTADINTELTQTLQQGTPTTQSIFSMLTGIFKRNNANVSEKTTTTIAQDSAKTAPNKNSTSAQITSWISSMAQKASDAISSLANLPKQPAQ